VSSWCRIVVAACRYGQASTVRYLLRESLPSNYGDISTVFTSEDASPLHFLAIFHDDDIPGIAQALVDWCALLDHIYSPFEREGANSTYLMRVAGTPLHAAIRLAACQVLSGANRVLKIWLFRGSSCFAATRRKSHHTLQQSRHRRILRGPACG